MNYYESWAWNKIKSHWLDWFLEKQSNLSGRYVSIQGAAIIEGSQEMWKAIGYDYPTYLDTFCLINDFSKTKDYYDYGNDIFTYARHDSRNKIHWYYALDVTKCNHRMHFFKEQKVSKWIWPVGGSSKGAWAYLCIDAAIVCLSWDWYNVTPQRILRFIMDNPEIKDFFRQQGL